MSAGLATIVMKPLNARRRWLMVAYVALGVGWWAILFGTLSLLGDR
jgi:hypothetical protein